MKRCLSNDQAAFKQHLRCIKAQATFSACVQPFKLHFARHLSSVLAAAKWRLSDIEAMLKQLLNGMHVVITRYARGPLRNF